MKRLLFSFISIGFGFLMVVVSAMAIGQEQVQGNASSDEVKMTPSPVTSASGSAVVLQLPAEKVGTVLGADSKVKYYLAYPGILPDHALYPLKMIRDRFKLWLAHTPESKIALLRLYADKRLGAAEALIAGGKTQLGVDTLVKSHGYLTRAITEIEQYDLAENLDSVDNQLKLHLQTVEELLEATEGDNYARVERTIKNTESLVANFEQESPVESFAGTEFVDEVEIDESLRPAELGR